MRQTQRFWRGHVSAWRRSGQTQAAYCESQSLSRRTLGYWSSKLRAGARSGPALVEVGKLTGPAACTVALDLLVGGHYVLRVKPGVDMQLLKAVLSALEA